MAAAPAPTVRPVILGGDIGAYATARTFHEAYGVRSVVLAGVSTWQVARSVAVDHRVVPSLSRPDRLVATLREVVAERPEVTHLLLASADWYVDALVAHRAELEAMPGRVVVPYAGAEALDRIGDKGSFTALCRELGLPVPETVVVRAPDGPAAAAGLRFPVVVKASSTTAYHAVSFPGQQKVDRATDPTALATVLARIAGAGFDGDLLVQEEIPGPDSEMAAVNLFFDADGTWRFAQYGRVLLEEHTPGALGNSVAQVTGVHRGVVDQARRLLEHVGWRGFANVDLKRDPRDGVHRFLEVNPRVGRSGYAVTASGYDISRMYVDGFVTQTGGSAQVAGAGTGDGVVGTNEHLFHVLPLPLVRRYVDDADAALVRRLVRSGRATNPLLYLAERDPRRWAAVAAAQLNQVRKFARYHPKQRPRAT
ncbi:carboxylate--amine ligase [Georgenia halophila]|uniref:Carboxylate--amine ligase n=1 Tax=Georgenia halophila TaxID=620889 RepID=A0ABP8LQJ4_9MICO